jgi:hypothetical protein
MASYVGFMNSDWPFLYLNFTLNFLLCIEISKVHAYQTPSLATLSKKAGAVKKFINERARSRKSNNKIRNLTRADLLCTARGRDPEFCTNPAHGSVMPSPSSALSIPYENPLALIYRPQNRSPVISPPRTPPL